MNPAETRGWNAGVGAVLAIADAAATRIASSPHHDFARAVLIQLAHDGNHLLIGPQSPEPMAALPAPQPEPQGPSQDELAKVMEAVS